MLTHKFCFQSKQREQSLFSSRLSSKKKKRSLYATPESVFVSFETCAHWAHLCSFFLLQRSEYYSMFSHRTKSNTFLFHFFFVFLVKGHGKKHYYHNWNLESLSKPLITSPKHYYKNSNSVGTVTLRILHLLRLLKNQKYANECWHSCKVRDCIT